MITKQILEELYIEKGMSVKQIASTVGCSSNKIIYWMTKFELMRRSRSDAVYLKHHPAGDPFTAKKISNTRDALLFGLGIGLYWGEGTKASPYSVRLGNSDPELLKLFIKFLLDIFGVDRQDLRFGLQIFSDIDPDVALQYWMKELGAERSQFYKPYITVSGSLGTYRKKSKFGVATVYYNNKKLRDILVGYVTNNSPLIVDRQ